MEWKEFQISEIATLINGRAYSQDELFEKGKYKIVRVGNLSGGNKWFFSDMELDADKYCYPNDLLFSWACNFGPHIWKNDKTIYHYHIWKVKEDSSKIDKYFFYYFLKYRTPYWLGNVNGSVMVHITKGTMEKQSIRIPVNLSDQRKIAGILSALDSKIENNNKINANLEAQAEALFKSWFVDFTPFKDQPFVDSELGPIPQGWKVGKINEFVDVIYGAPYKSKLFNTQKEGLPLIRIRDLKTCSPQFYTKELLPNTELVNYGDVVAGMDAEFTPHIWLGETGLLNQRVCKFKPHTGISPLYSMLMIKPKLEFAQNYKVGTTVSHLGKSDIDKFIVIVPPLDIVKEVSSIFDAVLNEQINLAKENQRLAALRDTLLPKLMSGEIKL